ncbi:MAG: acetyl-CoA acetyltransferase [Chloroflexi bacterium]|nr:acetyl-CoA acetyltransferase [Chloroflexota bacterium]
MQSIKDRVAIIGMGCAKFGERWDAGREELVMEACTEAFADARIKAEEIQAAWLGSFVTSQGGQALAPTLKRRIPVTRVENACSSGTDAFRNAAYAVASGVYDLVIAVGVEKLKDFGFSGLPPTDPRPTSVVDPEQPPPTYFAMMINRYMRAYGIDYDRAKRALALVAVSSHHNGSLNPKAHFQREVSLETVLNAPMICKPLGLYDCCGVSDGCAAAILTRPEIARRYRDDYVLVKGMGICSGDAYAQLRSDWDFIHFEENLVAAKQAFAEAGIANPREEIDMAEIHDCFTVNHLITMEDLGISPRGKSIEDIEAGFFKLDGGFPVNTDGGLKCFGHPIGASGLRMIYEVYKQLQGRAGPRQLKKIRRGLTHNVGGGLGVSTAAIAIFGREE